MEIRIVMFLLLFFSCVRINKQSQEMVKKIQFKGVVLEIGVCYKNYLCASLFEEKEKIKLSSFSCREGDNIVIGDSLVKKTNDLFMSVYRKNSSGNYEHIIDYSRW